MGAKYPAAPLGLITVAALLPREWEMRLIDMNASLLTEKDILWADIVFLGGMLPQQPNLIKLIELFHAHDKKVVVGGPDPSSQPQFYEQADYLVIGEAEPSIKLLLEDIANNRSKITYECTEKPDINTSPIPRYDLLNFNDYLMIGVQFSRGCPFNCEFCDIIELFGRIPRTKNPSKIMEELQTLYDLGYRGHVDFVDDNFIGNKQKVKEVLQELKIWLKEHKYPFYFSTEASINIADDDELLALMKETDFRYIFVGIESPDPEILKSSQKLQNVKRKLEDDLNKIYSFGLIVNAGFIMGFDQESKESVHELVKIVQEGKIAMAMIGLLYALPNTQLRRRLLKEKRILDNDSDITAANNDHTHVDQTSSGLNFITARPRKEILEDFTYAINQVYSLNNYFNRVLELGKVLDVKPMHQRKFRHFLKSMKAFARLIWKMGIFQKRGRYFWRNILILLFRKPSSIESIVNLMAMHLHFGKQTQFLTRIMQDRISQIP
jgi:radical SAM superfamily enzyme YgiQ (UPF0313 family)